MVWEVYQVYRYHKGGFDRAYKFPSHFIGKSKPVKRQLPQTLANKSKLYPQAPACIRLWYFRVGRRAWSPNMGLGLGLRFRFGFKHLHRPTVVCKVVHLFVAWIMIIFQRQICILPRALLPWRPTRHRGSGRAGALMATKWPSDMAYSPWWLCPARRSCHIFMPFLAHVCRECKSVEIFMFRTELVTPTTRCRCRALNIAQKRLKSLGQGARESGAGGLLVFYWMKWRAWRWFINVLQVQHRNSGAHENGSFR